MTRTEDGPLARWREHAHALAERITHPASRWRAAVAATPRHVFVPNWWRIGEDGWEHHAGEADPEAWLRHAYADTSVVTRVGPLHADHARPGQAPSGRTTSSATLPSLVVRMYRHGHLAPGLRILDVATGSGYGTGLLAHRFGDEAVTSIDVDPYLVDAATERLAEVGRFPLVRVCDATGPLPGTYDRIVSMVGMPTIPGSWVRALRPGGRAVTTIANTGLIVTATKQDDGRLRGQVEWERAGFMAARSGADYPPGTDAVLELAAQEVSEESTTGRYPVLDVVQAWDVWSMLEVTAPGIAHRYHVDDNGFRVALMAHADGSWARATATGTGPPTVHQSGPRRLWDALDEVRDHWVEHGELPLRGARVTVPPEGGIRLARGPWRGHIG